MKKAFTLLLVTTFLMLNAVVAQNDVSLRIHHKLGDNDFAFQSTTLNNLGNKFNLHRTQYYLSQFILVHDGGMETALQGVYALVNAGEQTVIELGNVNFNTIEGIKYSVGIDSAVNHLDPAQYAPGHPLAPQSPSMHWGWAAGYRFVCMEGFSGSTLSNLWEIHALGNNNYFEVSLALDATDEGGTYFIDVDGNYTNAIQDIDVSSGVVSHGDVDESAALLQNFRDHVFSPSPKTTTGISALQLSDVYVYPNPSNGIFQITGSALTEVESIRIINNLGQIIEDVVLSSAYASVELRESGVYSIAYLSGGTLIGISRVVVQ